MKKLLFLIYFLFTLTICFAQKEANIWYFGDRTGLDFNTEPPIILKNSKLSTSEGSGSIADSTGKLLCYSEGDTLWNKEHKIMENGTGLSHMFSSSSPSAAIIVRQPLGKKYYIFNAGARIFGDVFYSIIDMEANNGNGKVIVKRQLMVKQTAEKIALVQHANKRDIWIAVKQGYSDTLFVFLLTAAGISTSVLKHKAYLDYGATGQMKFSPDGKYLGLANVGNQPDTCCYLYNFDNRTGKISNQRKIHNISYALEFSPNSKYLYISAGYGLYQYPIKNIKTDMWPDSTCFYLNFKYGNGCLQLAPNGKIYGNTYDTFLRVINSPDQKGAYCNFQTNGQKFINTNKLFHLRSLSLPSFMASFLKSQSFAYASRCINEPTRFLLLDSLDNDSVKWIFGDTASGTDNFSNQTHNVSHTFKAYGSYTVSLVTYYDNRPDTNTLIVSFIDPKPDFIASDVCDKDTVRFTNMSSAAAGELTFSWKFGDGRYSLAESPRHLYTLNDVSKTYNVTLTVEMLNGCRDSINKPVTVSANPGSDFNFSTAQNKADFKAVQAGNTVYKWHFGNGDSASGKDIFYTYPKPGKYNACLKVINAANCFSQTCKTVSVTAGLSIVKRNSVFKIYPNPNTGMFEIRMDNPSKEEIHIQIFNSIGDLISSENDIKNNTLGSYSFNLELSSGIYFVKILNGKDIYFQKIVINAK